MGSCSKNGWTAGVIACNLKSLTDKILGLNIFKNISASNKDLFGYIVDTIGGLGVSRYLSW